MEKYQKHIAYSCGYYIKGAYDNNLSFYNSYCGINCMQWFVAEMVKVSELISSKIKTTIHTKQNINISNVKYCHICEEIFTPKDIIVRDHNHFTGEFRGFAHKKYNLNFKNNLSYQWCFII